MNKERRERLSEASAMLEDARTIIEECMSEEEEYRDNIPENLQGGEKYEKADSACEYMSEAVSNLEEAISNVEGTME